MNGVQPVAALKYTFFNKVFYGLVVPVVGLSPKKNDQSLLMIAQYKPGISPGVKLYSRVQLYSAFTNFNKQVYRYEQLRLGIEIGKIQFGIGVTFQQFYGQENILKNPNLGLFIRKELFN
jgi:hypothetical protein